MIRKRRKTKSGLIIIFVSLLLVSASITLYYWLGRPTFISPLPKGELRDSSSAESIETLLGKSNISFSEVKNSTDSSVLVKLTNGGTVLFSSKKSFKEQVSSLQPILSRLTIEGKRFKNLDLRFDKPSVVYE